MVAGNPRGVDPAVVLRSRPDASRPHRIVSLLPSATEILYAIGAGDDVVAVTHECDHPSEARGLPVVTASAINHEGRTCADIDRHVKAAVHAGSSIYRLDEGLLALLEADLVVTQELCDVCAVGYREVALAARRLPGDVPVVSLEPSTLTEILATIAAVGRVTGRDSQAAGVINALRMRIAGVEARVAPAAAPRMVCIEWTDPLMVGGHWVPEMVAMAGAADPLGSAGAPSRWISWEQIVAAGPEILVFMPCGFGLEQTLERAADVASRPGYTDLPCVVSGRVVAVDGSSFFNRPGPRIVDGLEILAAVVRAAPGDPLPEGGAWVGRNDHGTT